ncbi:MAG: transglutaminase-like domain-containing protein [Candidatus Aminicenantes bacterium]|nr:transglutaminase-like domain-containing protein [Candidatus Aminicenantes bacterium]
MRTLDKKRSWIVLFLSVVLGPSALSASLPPSDKWFLITIGGQPVGYIHDVLSRDVRAGGEVLVSNSEMKMTLNRLGTKVELRFVTGFEETAAGLLTKIRYEMLASATATKTEALVKDNSIEFRSESGGKSYTRTIPYLGTLVGQEGIRLASLKALKKPGDAVEFLTFMPELEAVSKGSRKVLGEETLRLAGHDLRTLKVEELIEAAAVKSTAWLNADHEVVKQEMATPFGPGVFVLSDRTTALAAASGSELPAEMFERSIIRSNIRLPMARTLRYLKVKLIHKNPDLGWPEIGSPCQTVVSKDRETLVLEIKRPALPKPVSFPVAATDKNREFLEPNAYIQSDESRLRDLVRGLIAGEKDLFQAVLKLERWVSDNMTFDLGIALAPSAEILQNRRGTCVGYATLLAAMARAAGIPSRVVMGYVYALGMFGGHAWTEVQVGDTWIPMDAAIVAPAQADAARLGFNAVSMHEGAGSLSGGAGQQLFGQVDIRILEYAGADGKKISVPEGAAPYRTTGDLYENPWLGLTFKKPSAFTFTKLDSVWPDPVLVALSGPDGAKGELLQSSLLPWKEYDLTASELIRRLNIGARTEIGRWNGRPMFSAAAPEKAVMIIVDKPEVWVLFTEGKAAPKLLDELAAGLKLDQKK